MNQHREDSEPTADSARTIRVAFWNLQNLFDVESSAIASELDYTPAFGWTRNALQRKIANLAGVINQMFDGTGPDLLGLCEIESEELVAQLLSAVDRDDLRLVKCRSGQTDALDTVLIYSDRIFTSEENINCGHNLFQQFPTRDIFEAHLRLKETDTELVVLVNHWPSRRSDSARTEPYRLTVARQCGQLIDSLVKLPRRDYLELSDNTVALYQLNRLWDRNILLMGDFNDQPWDRSVQEQLHAAFSQQHIRDGIEMLNDSLPSWRSYRHRQVPLFNPMMTLAARPDTGSCFSEQRHPRASLQDQFLLSRGLYLGRSGLLVECSEDGIPAIDIFRPSQMTDKQGRPIPFRVDQLTGYSDHFPIAMELSVEGAE